MENSYLLMPLNIIARHLSAHRMTQHIRANFVKIAFERLEKIDKIPENEREKVRDIANRIAEVEPELSAALLKKL